MHRELQKNPVVWRSELETWSSVSLPFGFHYFKEMLVPESESFNHLACEGVVSLISCTLVLASFRKSLQYWCHPSVPVRSDQPFRREMKAAFPHFIKKKKKKRNKAEKNTAPPGFEGTKPGLHS